MAATAVVDAPRDLLVRPQKRPLTGDVRVPGDKSISHRAVMLAALADGVSHVRDWLPAGDTLATLEAVRALGVRVEIEARTPSAWNLTIHGRGLAGFQPPDAPLDCRNAGTAIRLLAGIMAGQPFASVLDGSEQLRRRPMGRVVEPLRALGAQIEAVDGRCPLTISPATLRGTAVTLPVASAQVKSAVLLAGLFTPDETRVFEPGPARDHTERMLRAMGQPLAAADGWVTLPAAPDDGRRLAPLDMRVPGDISSAAFLLVAASIVPHSRLTLRQIGLNPTRDGLLDILRAMGAKVDISNESLSGGEPIADLTVAFDELHAVEVDGGRVVRAIDEFPIWAVAATQAAGDSQVREAAELRVKEVDRISRLTGELRRLAATIDEHDDGFTVHGPAHLFGAEVDSHGDHRLAMALAVAGLRARGLTRVKDAACIDDSFPGFVALMQRLGAEMEWLGAGV